MKQSRTIIEKHEAFRHSSILFFHHRILSSHSRIPFCHSREGGNPYQQNHKPFQPLVTFSKILLFILLFGLQVITAQTFNIEAFSDTTKYGWQDYLERNAYRHDFLERQDLLQLYEMEANSLRDCVIKSAIAPGWGQFANKHTTKGSVFLAAEIVLAGASLYFYDRSMYYYNKYLDATQVEDIETFYNAAVGPRQYSMIFLGVGALVWIYNIFDVIQGTEEYNAQVWKRIEQKHRGSGINFNGNGLEIRF